MSFPSSVPAPDLTSRIPYPTSASTRARVRRAQPPRLSPALRGTRAARGKRRISRPSSSRLSRASSGSQPRQFRMI
eukprot:389620-Pleurochrysis_carterae.AAC.1